MTLSSMRIVVRLWIPVAILVATVVVVSLLGANALWHNLNVERMDKVKAATMIALTTTQHFYARQQDGSLTEAQAQAAAKAVLRAVRYDQDENVFVYDLQGVNLVHGKKPELEGKNLSGLTDPNGLPVIRKLIEAAQQGGGFLEYGWARTSGAAPTDKIAYSVEFKPWGWMIGTGVYIDDMVSSYHRELMLFVGAAAGLVLLAGGVALAVGRSITGPLATLTGTMEQVAQGNLSTPIDGTDRKDEVGAMARALEVFRSTASDRQRLEQQQAAMESQTEQNRKQAMLAMAADFEHTVGGIIRTLTQTAHTMQGTAQGLEQAADQANCMCASVNSASSESTASVETVASASEELAASIAEISRRLGEANAIAAQAVDNADQANVMVNDLSVAAERISTVVKLITDIAEQTNLLALNATIEAARAGDAGKGFAVVANEVKQLASQTARATDEITAQIGSVQQETRGVVQVIAGIADVIRQIEQIAGDIASAVDQQGAATREISRNVQEASTGTGEVSRGIQGVSQAVEVVDDAAHSMTSSANALADMADQLQGQVRSLLTQVRA
ncbi:methyl-accepting chemotaxis protein [Insolitispirillum peregrinum]|uniref:methyl-accepting chemotaxis protein n=1 Tax=Insolitispirillum peregrinum TaxID=80876 RepID=UPI00360AE19B